MKTVNKIILLSCIFCYFAGIYIIALKFGLLKLLARYGLSELFDEIPKNFPEIKYLYWGLAIYTVIFLLLSIIILRTASKHGKEMDQVMNEASVVQDYSETLRQLLAQNSNNTIKPKLQMLQRQVAALPPAVIRDATAHQELSNIVAIVNAVVESNDEQNVLSAIDDAMRKVKSLQRKSVTRK
jgi:hypothetical protein